MSQENVEIVRRAYEALQRDDIEAFLAFVDPQVKWDSLLLEVEGVRRGHAGVRGWWRSIRSAFPEWNPSVVNVRSQGSWVVIHAHTVGRGAASGIGIDDDLWQVAEIRDGLVVRFQAFRTEGEALEAAGLSK